MRPAALAPSANATDDLPRAIVHRTRGTRHGPITRLMSPGDLGRSVKPFIFLDLFEAENFGGGVFPPHPHSGIATLTCFLEGHMTYADSTGKEGELTDGCVEWMQAGGGVWHGGNPVGVGTVRGYQLWLALPPELELASALSRYLDPGSIERAGPARVLLGHYEGKASPIDLPVPITYLHVRLSDGERWTFRPAADHDVAWLAMNRGRLATAGTTLEREMAVFADGNAPIELVADGEVEMVIGSSAKHPYPLVSGHYSVHTSQAALEAGESMIAALERTEAVVRLRGL